MQDKYNPRGDGSVFTKTGGVRSATWLSRLLTQARNHPLAATTTGLLPVALVLRFLFLGRNSFWLDEVTRVALVRLDWSGFWEQVAHGEGNMLFYHALLRPWIFLLGDTEFAVRSLSVLFGVAALPVFYLLAEELFNRRTAVLSVFLLTFNTFHLGYSQSARPYSLVFLLSVLASLYFVRSVRQPIWRNWVLYLLFLVLLVYTHLFGFLVLAVHCGALCLLPFHQIPWKRWFLANFIGGLLLAPAVAYVMTKNLGQLSFIREFHWWKVYDLFVAIAGGRPLLATSLALAGIGLVHGWRSAHDARAETSLFGFEFVLMWLCLPLATVVGISYIYPIFDQRYLMICLAPVLLLVARGAAEFRRPAVVALLLAALTLGEVRAAARYYEQYSLVEDWRGAVNYFYRHALPADALLFYDPLGRLPFEYYSEKIQHRLVNGETEFPTVFGLAAPAHATVDRTPPLAFFRGVPTRHKRVWLILFNDSGDNREVMSREVRHILERACTSEEPASFKGIRLILFRGCEKDPATAKSGGVLKPDRRLPGDGAR